MHALSRYITQNVLASPTIVQLDSVVSSVLKISDESSLVLPVDSLWLRMHVVGRFPVFWDVSEKRTKRAIRDEAQDWLASIQDPLLSM